MPDDVLPPIAVELIARTKDFKASMAEARGEVTSFNNTASSNLDNVSKVGKAALLGVAGGAIAVGLESVKMGAEFQKDTNLLVTAAGEVPANLGMIRKGIEDIATQTGTSLPQLTEGMYQVEKAGFRGAGGLDILRASAQGAAEEGADLGTVTNAMTSVMAAYGLKASDSVQVMNALKTAAGSTKDTMQNFAGSLSAVLPVASAAHLNFSQVAGAIAGMTRTGMSAQQASQDLANTINQLTGGSAAADKEMQQFGISSVDIKEKLGQRGLQGTLQYLVNTIGQQMGPQGLVMIGTFKKAQAAAQDAATMIGHMPPALADLSKKLADGGISVLDYRQQLKALPIDQAVMGRQFASLETQSRGFSDALRSGSPAATTMSAALKTMLGGTTGLNTALMLTGDNTKFVNDVTARTASSMGDSAKSVEGWASTSQLASIQAAKMREQVQVLFTNIGLKLIPILESATAFLAKHKDIVAAVAVAIGGLLVGAMVVYVAKLAITVAQSIAGFAKMVASAVAWVAENAASLAESASLWAMYTAEWLAEQAAGAAEWLGFQAAMFAESLASAAAWVGEQLAGLATVVAGWLAAAAEMAASAAAWAAEMLVAGATALLPFMPIILAAAAVAAAGYLLVTHWKEIWGFVKGIAEDAWHFIDDNVVHPIEAGFKWVVNMIKQHWDLILGILTGPIGLAIAEIAKHWDEIVWFFAQIPGKISSIAKGMWDPIWNAFKAVINFIIDGWNSLHFRLPSISLPFGMGSFGGADIGVPQLPRLASGGIADMGGMVRVGEFGPENLFLPRGAQVHPLPASTGGGGGGGTTTIEVPVYLDSQVIARIVTPPVRNNLLKLGRNMPDLFGGTA